MQFELDDHKIYFKNLTKDDKNIFVEYISYKFSIDILESDTLRRKQNQRKKLNKEDAEDDQSGEDHRSIKSDEMDN